MSFCISSYRDDIGLTVDLVGLVVEVSPAAVRFVTVTMATLETPSRDNIAAMLPTEQGIQLKTKMKNVHFTDVLVSVISTVEQQPQHGVVPEAVLQSSGEHCVSDHPEVTIHLRSIGQQQPHQLVPEQNEPKGSCNTSLFSCNTEATRT